MRYILRKLKIIIFFLSNFFLITYSFADNHAEIKMWKDPIPMTEPVRESSRNGFANRGKRSGYNDYWWVIERSTSKL